MSGRPASYRGNSTIIEECGCESDKYGIRYCAMHDAAPELLEALRKARDTIKAAITKAAKARP